ncbi:alpha/beta-type small acid-soluble spore protein [Clostridium sp. P21]|uniref:Alpha/beta-type small acid-soluble spore protein n=1 Tax=Clostridium muellerianum TaxID=2716538 RepID=A0A7Y0HQQ5_9CLOT|nr:small, acid-soluble spore protein, alpha/beta type [Clostridium muellerianum]NMM64053.1 alpha/beta-type small acid-soluble spore protein [Clostridium muellerianum]
MGKTPLKKVIKAKLKSHKELSDEEKLREKMKYEIAHELGLDIKVKEHGWGALTSEETGRIGGIMTKRKKQYNLPSNKAILEKEQSQ